MSIVVKGMEMPKNCTLCDSIGLNVAIGCPVMTGINGRATDCPLVELPEKHGRLIDADEKRLRITLKGIREGECQIYKGGSWGFAAKAETAIDDAPTVFEAEGQE